MNLRTGHQNNSHPKPMTAALTLNRRAFAADSSRHPRTRSFYPGSCVRLFKRCSINPPQGNSIIDNDRFPTLSYPALSLPPFHNE
jgi:hypothetical protein